MTPRRLRNDESSADSMTFLPRTLVGALCGGVVAVVLIAVGVLRAGVALAAGGSLGKTDGDGRMLVFYVVGFILAGAPVGAIGPGRSRVCAYGAFMIGGIVSAFSIVIGMKGSLVTFDVVDGVIILLVGPPMGAAMAHGWYRAPS